MDFATLTTTGGQAIAVNPSQVATVRDHAKESKPTKIVMANGQDFEVEESFDMILAALVGAS